MVRSFFICIRRPDVEHLLSNGQIQYYVGDECQFNTPCYMGPLLSKGKIVSIIQDHHGTLFLIKNKDYQKNFRVGSTSSIPLPGWEYIPLYISACGGQSGVLSLTSSFGGGGLMTTRKEANPDLNLQAIIRIAREDEAQYEKQRMLLVRGSIRSPQMWDDRA